MQGGARTRTAPQARSHDLAFRSGGAATAPQRTWWVREERERSANAADDHS